MRKMQSGQMLRLIPLPLLSPFALILTFHYKEAGYPGGVNGHHVVGSDGDYCGR
jgi:hypothetical protein